MARKSKASTKNDKGDGADEGCISKSISIPKDLLADALKKRVQPDPELDFSGYVRRLIRSDLEKEKTEVAA